MNYYNRFNLTFLEERTLLSAGVDLSHESDGEPEKISKKEHKQSKGLFSAFGHSLKKMTGHLDGIIDGKKDSKKVADASAGDQPEDIQLFKKITDEFLSIFGSNANGELSLIDKIQNTGVAKMADEALSAVDALKLLVESGESKVLDVINHFVANHNHLDSLIKAIKEGFLSKKSGDEQHAGVMKLVQDAFGADLAVDNKSLLDFILKLSKNNEHLTALIHLAETGAESLKAGSVHFATAVSEMLGNVDGVLDMIKNIKDNPDALKDPELQGVVLSMSENMVHIQKLLSQYMSMSSDEQLALVKEAQSLGVEVEAYLKKAKPELFNKSAAEDIKIAAVDEPEKVAPKKKTKNPLIRTLHYTKKYIAKPAIEEIKQVEEAIKEKILNGVHAIESKAKKLKEHLKSFASSDEKLKFILKDMKSVVKSIAHKAKSVFDAVNPTKENRSKWEHELAKLTRTTADIAVKFAHFVEDHTTYTPMVAKIGQYAQMIVLATSKTILLAAGAAGIAATAYPPAVMISLALVVASRGLDLVGDLIPLGLKAVDDLGHLHMRFINFMQGRAYNVADLMDKQADHLHLKAMEEAAKAELPFIQEAKLAIEQHNLPKFLVDEAKEEIQETLGDLHDIQSSIQYARNDIREDLEQAVANIDKAAVKDELMNLGSVVLEAATETLSTLSDVKIHAQKSGFNLDSQGIQVVEGALNGVGDAIPALMDRVNTILVVGEEEGLSGHLAVAA